jgi:hypothetical protein
LVNRQGNRMHQCDTNLTCCAGCTCWTCSAVSDLADCAECPSDDCEANAATVGHSRVGIQGAPEGGAETVTISVVVSAAGAGA